MAQAISSKNALSSALRAADSCCAIGSQSWPSSIMRCTARSCPSTRFSRSTRSRRASATAGWLSAGDAAAVLRAGNFALRHACLLQDPAERADAGDAVLEQVEADEGGEGQPPVRHEDRAALDAEREGQQDEGAGEDADQAVDGHGRTPGLKWIRRVGLRA